MENKSRLKTWLSQYITRVDAKRRKEIIEQIREASTPRFDYFFLVILSGAIATLGLINDSPAVIIGAMLVAPLMSPILGIGLGSITADTKLARDSATALIRAAVLSILLSTLLTLSNIYLPFVPSLLEIPHEILSRTQPTPNDLIIALAGGLAASYALAQPQLSAALPGVAIATALMPPLSTIGIGMALGRWDIAGGAALLFLTNAVTIAFAAILVFSLEGFTPRYRKDDEKISRTITIAGILTGLLLIPLTILGMRLVSQAQEIRLINQIVEVEIMNLSQADLSELNISQTEFGLQLDITISSNMPPNHDQIINLQEILVSELDQPVSLIVTHIRADTFDPLLPPTKTPTSTIGPSPTSTVTPSQTATVLPTQTATLTPTATVIPPTPTPKIAIVVRTALPPYEIVQEPGGPVIGTVRINDTLYDLNKTMIYKGVIWVNVMDTEGRIGWFPQNMLAYPTPTAIITKSSSN